MVSRKEFKKQDSSLRFEIEQIQHLRELLIKSDNKKFDKLLNIISYCLLVNRDIYLLCEYYYFEKDKHRKNLFGRLLSMTIFEFLNNVNFFIGKRLVEELNELKILNFEDLVNQVKKLNKDYSSLKKKYESELRKIRNSASAHKSKDAKLLFKYFTDLQLDNLTEIGFQIGFLENKFLNLWTLILQRIPFS